jgi:hypothetical protein
MKRIRTDQIEYPKSLGYRARTLSLSLCSTWCDGINITSRNLGFHYYHGSCSVIHTLLAMIGDSEHARTSDIMSRELLASKDTIQRAHYVLQFLILVHCQCICRCVLAQDFIMPSSSEQKMTRDLEYHNQLSQH